MGSVVVCTFLQSEFRGFADAMKGIGFSWGSVLILIACSWGPWLRKVSVSGTDIRDAFVSLFFIEIDTPNQLCLEQRATSLGNTLKRVPSPSSEDVFFSIEGMTEIIWLKDLFFPFSFSSVQSVDLLLFTNGNGHWHLDQKQGNTTFHTTPSKSSSFGFGF